MFGKSSFAPIGGPARRTLAATLAVGVLLASCSSEPSNGAGSTVSANNPSASATAAPTSAPVTVPAMTTPSSDLGTSAPDTAASTPVTTSSTSTAQPTTAEPSQPAPRPADGPALVVTSQDKAAAKLAVQDMSIREMAGTVIMASSADAVGSSAVADLGLGGVILMGSNGVLDGTDNGTPDEVATITADLQQQSGDPDFPLLVATDQEFGLVNRLQYGFTQFPAAHDYLAAGDQAPALLKKASTVSGTEMSAVGINVNFAPDADLLISEDAADDGSSAIGNRSYGADAATVGTMVAAAVTGYQSAGVAATLKHFPGLGGISTDTHQALPTFDGDCSYWNTHDRVPFRAGIKAGAALVMTGHVLMPSVTDDGVPASLSAPLVTDLLQSKGSGDCDGLEFTGLAVTDSLQMAPVTDGYGPGDAAWLALAAGEDLLLMPTDPGDAVDGIVGAVADGSLTEKRLRSAAVQVMTLRAALGHVVVPPMSVIDSEQHRVAAAEVSSGTGN